MKAFVINLKKRLDRKTHVEKTYPKIPFIDMEIIEACDGKYPINNTKEMNQQVINFIRLMKRNENRFKTLKYGELGAFISHFNIWNKIVNENIEKAVIFEDDVMKFENDFEVYLKEISMIDNDKFHIVWLNYPSSNQGRSSIYITKNIYHKKNTEHEKFLGTYGYVITLQGAKHLLDYIENKYKNTSIYGLDRLMSYAYKNLDYHYTREKLIHTTIWSVAEKTNSSDITNTDIQISSEKINNIDVYMKNIIQLIK